MTTDDNNITAAHNDELELVLDYAAGLLGLRIHAELVRVPILGKPQLYAYRNGRSYGFSSGMKIEVKEPVVLNASEGGQHYMCDRICKISIHKEWKKVAEALGWMLRGWGAEDKVLCFVSFFTALESIIPKSNNHAFEQFQKDRARAEEIANALPSAADAEFLKKFLQPLKPSTPINASFESWAKGAGIDGWEKDVQYFKKYNRIRNNLLHQGELVGVADDPIKGDDVVTIEQIAGRYVSYSIYGEATPYALKCPISGK